MAYIGRFAPSPTGPLHFGSLVAAIASYLEAKVHLGQWLIRMEDLDKPREVTGAAENILNTLEAFGFEWDKAVMYQSERNEAYTTALSKLQALNLVYPCTCTRKEVADTSTAIGIEGAIYPKTCLRQSVKSNHPVAWRIKTEDKAIRFTDNVQGKTTQNLAHDIGDFVLKRADDLFAYQLAVVVDDAEQGISHIVRGSDLLTSTPRQIYLQQVLGLQTPHYTHIPVVANTDGQKLSKQTLAQALDVKDCVAQLWNALDFLNQTPPETLRHGSLQQCWQWAIDNWCVANVPKCNSIAR